MKNNKEYFVREITEGMNNFDSLSEADKLKYLTTAEQMSEKSRLEMLTSIPLGEEYLFFYGSGSPFSQQYKSSFIVDNIEFTCAEQYMMYMKAILFKDSTNAEDILNTGYNPQKNREQGRMIEGFIQDKWDDEKKQIVWRGNYCKFNQNSVLKEVLLATSPKTLVEANPYDTIWGIGLSADDPMRFHVNHWKGTNLLGYILTSVRVALEKGLSSGQANESY